MDAQLLALVGHSLGGYAALAAGAIDPRFKALVSIGPLVEPAAAPLSAARALDYASLLAGVTPLQLQTQWARLTPITALAPRLAGCPILLVTAERDELFPPEHYRGLLGALPHLQHREIARADHAFSVKREDLVELVTQWLDERMNYE